MAHSKAKLKSSGDKAWGLSSETLLHEISGEKQKDGSLVGPTFRAIQLAIRHRAVATEFLLGVGAATQLYPF
jgi:hypothetical protein